LNEIQRAYIKWEETLDVVYPEHAFSAGWAAALKNDMNHIGALMQQIAKGDYAFGVFDLSLSAGDHYAGFRASATMRGSGVGLEARGDTPEAALADLRDLLEKTYGVCPHCGQHRGTEKKE
jgi:hypothetical protein